jgi:hypothetical protein
MARSVNMVLDDDSPKVKTKASAGPETRAHALSYLFAFFMPLHGFDLVFCFCRCGSKKE